MVVAAGAVVVAAAAVVVVVAVAAAAAVVAENCHIASPCRVCSVVQSEVSVKFCYKTK